MNTLKLVLLATTLGLTACSSALTKKDCMEKDPYQMGLKDGKEGKTDAAKAEFENKCSGMGVTFNNERYDFARKTGLNDYCSDSRAKDDAKRGNKSPVCVNENINNYSENYDRAVQKMRDDKEKDLRDLQKKQDDLRRKQEKTQEELQKING